MKTRPRNDEKVQKNGFGMMDKTRFLDLLFSDSMDVGVGRQKHEREEGEEESRATTFCDVEKFGALVCQRDENHVGVGDETKDGPFGLFFNPTPQKKAQKKGGRRGKKTLNQTSDDDAAESRWKEGKKGNECLDEMRDEIRVRGSSRVGIVSISPAAKKKDLFVSLFLLLLIFRSRRWEEENPFPSSPDPDARKYDPFGILSKRWLGHCKPLERRTKGMTSSFFFFFFVG